MSKLKKAVTILGMFARAVADKGGRHHLVKSLRAYINQSDAECPCCGYSGKFWTHGYTARIGVACPRCGSIDRHRLITLAATDGFFDLSGRRVLHFAPEQAVAKLVRSFGPAEYRTADISPGRADMVVNIEAIHLPDSSVDVVIASHILEHVDDRKALSEIRRILSPGGQMIAMVPLIEGWPKSYEDSARRLPDERAAHFGQPDHVRYYGSDFRDRIRQSGFSLNEFTAEGAESVRYRLNRGEKVFLATKLD